MAIFIREYMGGENAINENSSLPLSLTESSVAFNAIADDSVMVDIEGIHVGPTRNFTWYTEQALKTSIPTWTKPYNRPFILHHNERDGKIIGRVLNAEYASKNTRSKTGALIFTCNVADDEGKKGVQDGRLQTVSIGVIAKDVRCSICGEQIELESDGSTVCGHDKGNVYGDKVCYWMVYEMEAKELSYVIVPSDIYAHNIKVYKPSNRKPNELTESSEEGDEKGMKSIIKEININIGEIEDLCEEEEKEAEGGEEAKGEEGEGEKMEEKEEGKTVDELTSELESLRARIGELKGKLADEQKKAAKALEMQQSAEDELITLREEMKNYEVDQVVELRSKLGRPVVTRESLLARSRESILDTLSDLKEEVSSNISQVNLTESIENVISEENTVIDTVEELTESVEEVHAAEEVEAIKPVLNESLVDLDKDTSTMETKNEGLDVKESDADSNIDYEATIDNFTKYFNL